MMRMLLHSTNENHMPSSEEERLTLCHDYEVWAGVKVCRVRGCEGGFLVKGVGRPKTRVRPRGCFETVRDFCGLLV